MKVFTISGRTSLNTPIKALIFNRYPNSTYSPNRRHSLIFMSSWQARNWFSIRVILNMIPILLNYNQDKYGTIHPLVTRHEIILIPLPNPDGYTHTITKNRFWPKNFNAVNDPITGFTCKGVNLFYNSASVVKTDFYNKKCDDDFDGRYSLSEQESFTVMRFIENKTKLGYPRSSMYYVTDLGLSSLVPSFTDHSYDDLPVVASYLPSIRENLASLSHNELNYSFYHGYAVIYPPLQAHFLEDLMTKGLTKAYNIRIPLNMEKFVKPIGEEISKQQADIARDILELAGNYVQKTREITSPLIDIITFVAFAIPISIFFTSYFIVIEMHVDTVEREARLAGQPRKVDPSKSMDNYQVTKIGETKVHERKIGSYFKSEAET